MWFYSCNKMYSSLGSVFKFAVFWEACRFLEALLRLQNNSDIFQENLILFSPKRGVKMTQRGLVLELLQFYYSNNNIKKILKVQLWVRSFLENCVASWWLRTSAGETV